MVIVHIAMKLQRYIIILEPPNVQMKIIISKQTKSQMWRRDDVWVDLADKIIKAVKHTQQTKLL